VNKQSIENMSAMLRTMRLVRPSLPMRVMVARPAVMTRGYPARSEMSDDEADVNF